MTSHTVADSEYVALGIQMEGIFIPRPDQTLVRFADYPYFGFQLEPLLFSFSVSMPDSILVRSGSGKFNNPNIGAQGAKIQPKKGKKMPRPLQPGQHLLVIRGKTSISVLSSFC
jgi:hypothetical protein